MKILVALLVGLVASQPGQASLRSASAICIISEIEPAPWQPDWPSRKMIQSAESEIAIVLATKLGQAIKAWSKNPNRRVKSSSKIIPIGHSAWKDLKLSRSETGCENVSTITIRQKIGLKENIFFISSEISSENRKNRYFYGKGKITYYKNIPGDALGGVTKEVSNSTNTISDYLRGL